MQMHLGVYTLRRQLKYVAPDALPELNRKWEEEVLHYA